MHFKRNKRLIVRIMSLVLCICTILCAFLSTTAYGFNKNTAQSIYKNAKLEELDVKAYSVVDFSSGTLTVKGEAGYTHFTVGNLVKTMTLYLTFEAVAAKTLTLDSEVRVTKNAQNAGTGRESVFLDYGKKEVISVKQAIEAICVANANDAAYALSETLAMNEAEFVTKMNAKAKELGLKDTCFVDSTGIKTIEDGQYSCANDIAVLTCNLIKKFPESLEYTKVTYGHFEHTSTRQPKTEMISSNDLIRKKFMENCDGFLTGYSKADGYAQCATATVDGKREVAVVLGAKDKSTRAATLRFLMEYAAKNYSYALIATGGTFVRKVNIKEGKNLKIKTAIASDFYVIMNVNDVENVKSEIILDGDLKAPVEKGKKVGYVVYKLDDVEIGRAELVTDENMDRAGWFTRLIRKILEWLGIN
ncbi:MAG: D-alanyl-D-alanine carboxypeptidase [Ruminococcaceae bacterium]|nr:D-alanyl-D-alanine carboxypeptidase [Oscillospiraceae bacterium]